MKIKDLKPGKQFTIFGNVYIFRGIDHEGKHVAWRVIKFVDGKVDFVQQLFKPNTNIVQGVISFNFIKGA